MASRRAPARRATTRLSSSARATSRRSSSSRPRGPSRTPMPSPASSTSSRAAPSIRWAAASSRDRGRHGASAASAAALPGPRRRARYLQRELPDVFGAFGGDRNLGISLNFNRRVSATTQGRDRAWRRASTTPRRPTQPEPPPTRSPALWHLATSAGRRAQRRPERRLSPFALTPRLFYTLAPTTPTTNTSASFHRPGIGNPAATAANFRRQHLRSLFLLPYAASVAISESTPAFFKNPKNLFQRRRGSSVLPIARLPPSCASWSHANISYPGWIQRFAPPPPPVSASRSIAGQDPWYPIFRRTAGPSIYDPASYTMNFMQK